MPLTCEILTIAMKITYKTILLMELMQSDNESRRRHFYFITCKRDHIQLLGNMQGRSPNNIFIYTYLWYFPVPILAASDLI